MRMSCPNLFFGITMACHAKAIHRLGWTLLVLGTLSIILGTAAVAIMASKNRPTFLTYIAGPIWSGIFVLSTGILGVVSGKNPKNNWLIVAFMVLGIFTILATFCSFGLAVTGAIVDSCYWRWIGVRCGVVYVNASDYDYYNGTATNFTAFDYFDKDDCTTTAKALHGVNALLAFAELVLGFVVSIMCCCGLCSATNTPNVIYGPGVAPAQIMSDGQGGFILLQAVPDSRQFGAQQQVFLAPPGGPHAPLQVYYTAGQAPPQYAQPGGMGATEAPPQYTQAGGMGATEAPPQYAQPGGMRAIEAPPQYAQPGGMGAAAAPPQYAQPGGMGAAAAPPQYAQPGGMGAAAAPPQYAQPGGMGAAAAPPQYTQPGGVGAAAAPPQYAQPGGVGTAAAPPQYAQPGGVGTAAAPPQYTQPGGEGAAAAPPQYAQPGGVGAAAAPPQYAQPGGMGAAAAPPQYDQHAATQATEAPPMESKTPLSV